MHYFETKELFAGYNKKIVVENVSLQLEKGEILSLIGQNGCGKSTILKTIAGQLQEISGCVTVDKRDIKELPQTERAKAISVLLTDRIRPELMSVREVVAMGRYPYTGRMGILTNEDKAIVDYYVRLLELADIGDSDYMSLSDGQKQRVLIARALCQEPEILILDEPTSYLDIRYKLSLMDILKTQARDRSLTIIMSVHEPFLAEYVSDRVVGIKNGHITAVGRAQQVMTKSNMKQLYELSDEMMDIYSRIL